MTPTKPGISTHGKYTSKMRIPKSGLSDKEYDKRKLLELRKKKRDGTLTREEIPYLHYLEGERVPKRYKYHRKARTEICRLSMQMPTQDIYDLVKYEGSVIEDLLHGYYGKVSASAAEKIYFGLKGVGV